MKQLARTLSLLFLCVSMLLISGCSALPDDIKLPSEILTNPTTAVPETAPSQEQTSATEPATVAPSAPPTETTTLPSYADVTISETVLYDANEIKITATELEEDWLGTNIQLLIENNSTTNILVTVEDVSINGYMSPLSMLYVEVAAGKKAYDSISLSSTTIDQAPIEVLSNIEFYINISDADTWSTLYTSDLLSLQTSVSDYVQPIDDSGDVLYDNNDIRVVCKGLKQDIIWDGTIVFFIENNSGKDIIVSAENVSVNGFMCSASLWSTLRNGTVIIDGMSLLNLEEIQIDNIDKIENIEFSLSFIGAEDWSEIDTTEVISLTF